MNKLFLAFLISLFSLSSIQASSSDNPQVDASTSPSLIQQVEEWYKANTNYYTITFLMACESSILPVPSEMVIPPAVFVAMDPDSDLSILLIIVFGTIGALIGASFNYIMAMWLGRMVIYKFADSKLGKVLMLSSDKIKKSEQFFNDHGKTSTFIGRLIPVVRHFISIPAGLAKMNYLNFAIYTLLGAGLWNCILAALGYYAHGQKDLIYKYSHELSYLFVIIAVVLLIWLLIKINKKKK